jgi:hypothetical protein
MTDTERQLRARLDPELVRLMPGPPPLAAIVRDGRRIRARKRMTFAAGVAVAAALVIVARLTLPSVLSGPPAVPPLTTHYHVTANPPGAHSQPGLIASGKVNGVPWSVRAEISGRGYLFTGVDAYVSAGADGNLPGRYARGVPVEGFLGTEAGPAIQVEAVRADVTLVEVRLTNGQILRLRPVAAVGPGNASLVAFAMPDYRDVLAIEAFDARGEMSYAIPWTGHAWFMTERWLKPGQPALPRPQTVAIGSGTAFGQSWRQLLSVGPWGWCGQGDVEGRGGGGGCTTALPPLRPGLYYQAVGFAGGSVIGKSGLILSAEVADSVAVVEVTTHSGQHSWIRPHRVGGRSFVSFASAIGTQAGPAPLTIIRWTAYDQHHHVLGAGTVS